MSASYCSFWFRILVLQDDRLFVNIRYPRVSGGLHEDDTVVEKQVFRSPSTVLGEVAWASIACCAFGSYRPDLALKKNKILWSLHMGVSTKRWRRQSLYETRYLSETLSILHDLCVYIWIRRSTIHKLPRIQTGDENNLRSTHIRLKLWLQVVLLVVRSNKPVAGGARPKEPQLIAPLVFVWVVIDNRKI